MEGDDTCRIEINVVSLSPGAFVNTIPVGALTATGGVTNINPGTDTLRVGALYSLGNRVWFDTDNDGTINSSEVGVNDVTVQLYSDVAGVPTLRGTQITDQDGYYRFDDLEPGDYTVVIPASQFATGGALSGYWSSGTTINAGGVTTDGTSNDPDNDADSDENGLTQTSGTFDGAVISNAITLGPGASEPTNDGDMPLANPFGESPDDYSNRSVDFGFYRVSLGNLVFLDANGNGTYDGPDSPIPGAEVRLFAANGTTQIGGFVTSDSDGFYLFDGLTEGDYVVKVTPPAAGGYSSTVDTADSADTTNPDNNTNNNDNGVGIGLGQVSSNPVTLMPGAAQSNNTVNDLMGTTYNPTLDFGFLLYSLGNRVWYDTNNDGVIQGAEQGISGVRVELYRDTNGNGSYNAGDTFMGYNETDSDGYYRFDDLPAGDYVVVIPGDNFRNVGAGDNMGTDPLAGYWSTGVSMNGSGTLSESATNDPDNDRDASSIAPSDENGVTTFTSTSITAVNPINYVSSSAVTLGGAPAEPTGETAPNGQGSSDDHANMTVDFGFYHVEIGDLIFSDYNESGAYEASFDDPLANAIVQLFTSDGTTEIPVGSDGGLGTSPDAAGGVTTGVSGLYAFSGLPAGDYILKVTPPSGYASTVDTAAPADTTDPDVNVDNNDNGIGTLPAQVSSGVLTINPTTDVASASLIKDNDTGNTADTSVDFGFISPYYSLGNRVWFDTDNDGSIDVGESGVNNVRVQLFNSAGAEILVGPDGILGTVDDAPNGVLTAGGGYYRFENLPAGDYVVRIPNSNFAGGTLAGYWSSGTLRSDNGTITDGIAPDPDDDNDSDDNGATTFRRGRHRHKFCLLRHCHTWRGCGTHSRNRCFIRLAGRFRLSGQHDRGLWLLSHSYWRPGFCGR